MTKNTTTKASEVAEKTTTASQDTWEKIEDFFDKYKKGVIIGAVGIVVAAGAYGGLKYMQTESNEEASNAAWTSSLYWESDSLDKAIPALQNVVEEYGSTDPGNVAKFQLGAALLQKGKYQDAIDQLKDFNGHGDFLIQARAYCLIGDAYSELNSSEDAISYYEKAANEKPNEQFTPRYLVKLGIAYEEAKDYAKASEAYDKILKEYPACPEAFDAKKYKSRADQLAAK
jgi:predicted negative regulator of RcsB-dependent stress response